MRFVCTILTPVSKEMIPYRGGVAERSNATGCKPVDLTVYVGSNPTPSNSKPAGGKGAAARGPKAGVQGPKNVCRTAFSSVPWNLLCVTDLRIMAVFECEFGAAGVTQLVES